MEEMQLDYSMPVSLELQDLAPQGSYLVCAILMSDKRKQPTDEEDNQPRS
jgi:hypothetical protein